MLIDYDKAVWAVAVQLAFEADMEYSGEHNPEDYLSIAKMYFDKIEVIEAPKRGRWMYTGTFCGLNRHKCSACGRGEFRMSDYCPNCGARMEASND